MLDLDKEKVDAERVNSALEDEIEAARRRVVECLDDGDTRGVAAEMGKIEAFERAIHVVDTLSHSRHLSTAPPETE